MMMCLMILFAIRKVECQDVKPVPDPTVLTTQQLFRELGTLRENQIRETGILRELYDAKIQGIAVQINENRLDFAQALAAAEKNATEKNILQTQAIAKSETITGDQIKQLYVLIKAAEEGLNGKIKDTEKVQRDIMFALKERLDRLEGQNAGISASWFVLIGVFGILSVCVAIFTAIRASAAHLLISAKEAKS
jgi:hypothetical protein